MLRGAAAVGVPGLLIEHSFHTCTRSAKWLLDDGNLDRLAKAEAQVLAEHFGMAVKQEPTEKPEPEEKPETFTPYIVRITDDELNVRKGPGMTYDVVTVVKKGEAYTIVDVKYNGPTPWGKLKSGAGWISLNYTEKR